jgi:hypothetical protein
MRDLGPGKFDLLFIWAVGATLCGALIFGTYLQLGY